MRNFVLQNPTKLIFGQDTISSIGLETRAWGRKVFLIYGKSSAKTHGLYERVNASLLDAGCEITEFAGVSSNPKLSMIRKAISCFRSEGCEVICAIGGGSVIDTGKAVSCGAVVNHDVWKFFTAKKKVLATIPLTVVCSIAGSGSENNSGMVVTNDETHQKFGYGSRLLFPKVSILDPEVTFSVPPHLTAFGCVDTICHLVEFYCNNSAEYVSTQFRIMEALILEVFEHCETTLELPDSYTSRAELMWTSALALSGIFSAGLGRIGFPAHLIEHSVSSANETTHGAGLAVILPAWMRHHSDLSPEQIARLGRRIFHINEGDDRAAAKRTAELFSQKFSKLGCPSSLKELGVSSDHFEKIAAHSQALAKLWRLREYDEDAVLSVLRNCS